MTHRAFCSPRGLVGGLALLALGVLTTLGLSACGAPAYTYVADSKAGLYYKVPSQWHPISQNGIDAALKAAGSSSAGLWSDAFDAESAPSGDHFLASGVTAPFVYSEVGNLSATVSNELSYNVLRDFMLPVTSTSRTADAKAGFSLTGFKELRDQIVTGKQGVHGVRETFQYTFPGGIVDTFDEDSLTNADNTTIYFLLVHCTAACYSQNENSINTVMSSFTVGSPT